MEGVTIPQEAEWDVAAGLHSGLHKLAGEQKKITS